ncbi:RICIN domain-containing protein [Streptomyces sp. NPDC002779]|uniref:RICIN domain-containing protein n=1 Tax=Streptomyces sp. NPDC002779 TaxID=3364664 RepID=UPI003690A840
MPTPHPPRPPYPPPAGAPEESDDGLAARLRGRPDGETSPAVALLMARHWRTAQEYAVICLASRAEAAAMVTSAAFHQLLDRLARGEPGTALRPRLLVAVRDTVRLWAAEERISAVLPDLGKPAGGRGIRTAKSMTAENRKLAGRSFHALPGPARCLLWHTEVEAEAITVPAGLLGMDTDTASVALEQAREKFREGCVLAHRELAPTKDCRFYNRLLDVPMRRGGALLPDVQQHLAQCRYCRSAAEQLSHFEGALGTLLAESVLGWGARRYLDSRPGRTRPSPRPRGPARHGGGRRRLLPRVPPQLRGAADGPRPSRALLTGVGIASAGLLASVLAASVWSDDDGSAPPGSAADGGTGTQAPPTVSTAPPGTARLPVPPRRTGLRNAAADLCLDIRDTPKPGAGTELAACSAADTQQWSYEEDGLLRSAAQPGLCLDSKVDAGVVVLGRCADEDDDRADDVRYDLTVQGELLPRWDERLALTSTNGTAGADIVVKVRDGTDTQRWLADPGRSAPADPLSVAAPPARAD